MKEIKVMHKYLSPVISRLHAVKMADTKFLAPLAFALLGLFVARISIKGSKYRYSDDQLLFSKAGVTVSFNERIKTGLTSSTCRGHVAYLRVGVNGCFGFRASRYPNTDSTFNLSRLVIRGDICPNPGPSTRTRRQGCLRTIAINHRLLECATC